MAGYKQLDWCQDEDSLIVVPLGNECVHVTPTAATPTLNEGSALIPLGGSHVVDTTGKAIVMAAGGLQLVIGCSRNENIVTEIVRMLTQHMQLSRVVLSIFVQTMLDDHRFFEKAHETGLRHFMVTGMAPLRGRIISITRPCPASLH